MGVYGRPHPHRGWNGPHDRVKQSVDLSHPRKAESSHSSSGGSGGSEGVHDGNHNNHHVHHGNNTQHHQQRLLKPGQPNKKK